MQGRGAGVEIALWDIRGKQLNAPMHELLGGKLRDRIRVYCDCHSGAHWTREDYSGAGRRRGPADNWIRCTKPAPTCPWPKKWWPKDTPQSSSISTCPTPGSSTRTTAPISRRQHHHIVTTIESLRQAIGPYIDLSIDLHGSFNLADAAHLQRRGAPRPAVVGGSHPLGVGQCRRLGQDLPADRDADLHRRNLLRSQDCSAS